jgi:4-amino-4-deoxy-L-arabinose transferase-like glycosyltransferase
MGGIVLLAFGLRLARLGFQPLWWDEGWSVYFAAADIPTLLERTAVDIHPPLYYLLLRAWSEVVGWGVPSLRLLSVLIGTAAVPLLYLVGRRLLGRQAGLLAALLLAVSPLHVYYSQEVRMYGLVTLFGLAALLFALAWQAEARARRWAYLLGYVLAATAALHTQYYSAFLLLGLNLAVLVGWLWPAPGQAEGRPRRRPAIAAWLAAQLAVLLLTLPWLLYSGQKLLTYVRFKVSVEKDPSLGLVPYLARHLSAFFAGHTEGGLAAAWWLGLLPLAFLLLALAWRRRVSGGRAAGPRAAGGLAFILAAALLCGWAVNRVLPFNPPRSERLLLLALPAALLLVAAGLAWLARRGPRLAAAVVASFVAVALVSLGFFYAAPRYPDDDYRPVAARIRALGLPGDAVLAVHPWQWGYMRAYIPRDEQRPALALTPREVIPRERQIWADEPAQLVADLEALLARHGRLWLLDHQAMGRVLEEQIEAYLVDNAYPALSEWHGENTVLSLFAAGEPLDQPISATFGDWLALEAAALGSGPLEAGRSVLPVDLTWRPTAPAASRAAQAVVGLRLVGPTGHVWAQRDAQPRDGLLPFAAWPAGEAGHDRHGLLVPAGTPPGDYRLALRVYDGSSLEVLPATFAGGSGGEVILGNVQVVRPAEPPPVEALPVDQPLDVTLEPLRLLGTSLAEQGPLLPGQVVNVDLFWQALSDPGQDFLPRLQLVDEAGQAVSELVEKPVAGSYPTAWWQAGELVRDPHALPVAAGVAPGRYRLVLSLLRAADGSLVEPQHGPPLIELGEVEVVGRDRAYEPPTIEHRQEAAFGRAIALAGYALAPWPAAPGVTLGVTLTWHALDTPQANYHTFVHLLDDTGNIVAQGDGPPGDGRLPTLGWLPGEYVADSHALSLPAGLPAGQYRLAVGLYDPVTLQRPAEPALLDTPVTIAGEAPY